MMLLFHHFEAVVQDIVLLFVFIYFQVLLLGRQNSSTVMCTNPSSNEVFIAILILKNTGTDLR